VTPVERAPDSGNRAAITVCVILATLMQALDTTIANVALPGDLDDIYGIQRLGCERQPSLPACINFSILDSPPTIANPSTRAIPVRLKHHRNYSAK